MVITGNYLRYVKVSYVKKGRFPPSAVVKLRNQDFCSDVIISSRIIFQATKNYFSVFAPATKFGFKSMSSNQEWEPTEFNLKQIKIQFALFVPVGNWTELFTSSNPSWLRKHESVREGFVQVSKINAFPDQKCKLFHTDDRNASSRPEKESDIIFFLLGSSQEAFCKPQNPTCKRYFSSETNACMVVLDQIFVTNDQLAFPRDESWMRLLFKFL